MLRVLVFIQSVRESCQRAVLEKQNAFSAPSTPAAPTSVAKSVDLSVLDRAKPARCAGDSDSRAASAIGAAARAPAEPRSGSTREQGRRGREEVLPSVVFRSRAVAKHETRQVVCARLAKELEVTLGMEPAQAVAVALRAEGALLDMASSKDEYRMLAAALFRKVRRGEQPSETAALSSPAQETASAVEPTAAEEDGATSSPKHDSVSLPRSEHRDARKECTDEPSSPSSALCIEIEFKADAVVKHSVRQGVCERIARVLQSELQFAPIDAIAAALDAERKLVTEALSREDYRGLASSLFRRIRSGKPP